MAASEKKTVDVVADAPVPVPGDDPVQAKLDRLLDRITRLEALVKTITG